MPMTRRQEHKVDVAHQRWLRHVLSIRWQQHISNDEVLRRTGQIAASVTLRRARLRWLGHVLRMGRERHAGTALEWIPEGGNRRPGGQSMTFRRTVERDLQEAGIDWQGMRQQANDRKNWRSVVARVGIG